MSGQQDSNLRPPGPKPGALTGLRHAPNSVSAEAENRSENHHDWLCLSKRNANVEIQLIIFLYPGKIFFNSIPLLKIYRLMKEDCQLMLALSISIFWVRALSKNILF